LLNSLNISSKGDPGGNSNGKGLDVVFIVCVVDIFTTEGISFSARSANESGIFLLCDSEAGKIRRIIIKVKLINFL
tara:strand:+ start:2053 stop:2280 length:228 start_codon:yes stop_codon:yes gene_type:complete